MLDFHKENNADVTIAAMPVPIEEASRFGVVMTDENNKIKEFEEKPEHPRSNLASMGIYIFNWKVLRDSSDCYEGSAGIVTLESILFHTAMRMESVYLLMNSMVTGRMLEHFRSYWEANMELIDLIPEFNLYEEYWKIYTKSDNVPPQYIAADVQG